MNATTYTYRQLQTILKLARQNGIIPQSFKLNQKKAILAQKLEEITVKPQATKTEPKAETKTEATLEESLKSLAIRYENYIPLYEIRPLLKGNRKEQDQQIYNLERNEIATLSTLEEQAEYTDEQIAQGIESGFAGTYFFLSLN